MSRLISVSPLPTPPVGTSQIIGPSYAGFGIEPSNLYSFTGDSDPNELSLNLLNNLANYTGVPPHLRIGGNTGDYMIYDPSYGNYDVGENPDPIGQGINPSDHMIIGPRFWEVIDRFPPGTPITYGLNLAYSEDDYIERITAVADAVRAGLKNVNLVSLEIGNEPDLYLQNGFRTGEWGGEVYAVEWLQRAEAVSERVLVPNGIPSDFFEPAATASTIGTNFRIIELESYGITDSRGSAETFVSSWNQHDYYYFIGVSSFPLTMDYFTDLSTTNAQFQHWVEQTEEAVDTGYPYALREMGVVGPIGLTGITDTFAASLWTLNFFLYTAGLNISSVQMHMTENSNASAWQPIPLYGNEPFVRPNYYAFAAMAQLIGPGCSTRVIGVPIESYPAGYENRIACYTTYREGRLSAMVFINTVVANVSEPKESLTVHISLPDFADETLHLSYLTAEGADAMHGTTWNGMSYEETGDGAPTVDSPDQGTVTISSDGVASIEVRDSQAVVANIGSVIGSDSDRSETCNAASAPDTVARSRSSSSSSSSCDSESVAKVIRPSWTILLSISMAFTALNFLSR